MDRDIALLFVTRAIRMFGYGLLSVVLVLYLTALGMSAPEVARCFGGGVLMGWGSLLIPGSNDGLILIGMPLLWPYAWAAFATMCLCIGSAQWLQRRDTLRAG